jgi:hypothetical protein
MILVILTTVLVEHSATINLKGGIVRIVKLLIQISVVLSVLSIFSFENIDAQSNRDNLSKLTNYESSYIGLLNPPIDDVPLIVHAAFHLQDINEINDETETFQFVGFLNLTWHDPRRSFDPKVADVDEKVYRGNFLSDELSTTWYPQVDLVNTYGLYEHRPILLTVKSDGTCTLIESMNAAAKGRLNLTRYPFDNQNLKAYFRILGFKNNEVVFKADSSLVTFDQESIRVPQWTLTSVDASVQNIKTHYSNTNDVSSTFVISLDVKRESLFMMRLVVIPLALIAILSWSVFWMDKSSLGDRMSVSFVGILTAVTYQVVVSGILPKISDFTMIHGFLNINFFIMCSTVVINLMVGALDRSGKSEYGDRLDRISRWAFPAVYALMNFTNWIFFY